LITAWIASNVNSSYENVFNLQFPTFRSFENMFAVWKLLFFIHFLSSPLQAKCQHRSGPDALPSSLSLSLSLSRCGPYPSLSFCGPGCCLIALLINFFASFPAWDPWDPSDPAPVSAAANCRHFVLYTFASSLTKSKQVVHGAHK